MEDEKRGWDDEANSFAKIKKIKSDPRDMQMTLGCSLGNELVRIRQEKEFRIEFPSAPARHFSLSPGLSK